MITGQVYEYENFHLPKMSVKLYNFRVPVYKVFFSHQWNDTNPLTMIAVQVYECEIFHLLKNKS